MKAPTVPRRLSYIVAKIATLVLARALADLPAGDRSWLARASVRDRFSNSATALAHFCEQALNAWKNR